MIYLFLIYKTLLSYIPTWKKSINLAWPITVDKSLRTFMRTTDIIVTGLFSPAAIAAIGLADLYAQIPTRIGTGLGGGAIALSSQDTGSGAINNRDETITQALILGAIFGIPMAIFGVFFGYYAIKILGAPNEVAQMGGTYLAIIFLTAPARHVGFVGSRSLQGVGDTVTPMKINMAANGVNILITVLLGLGIGIFPMLGIVGVGIGTASGNVLAALLFLIFIYLSKEINIVKPTSFIILKQLLIISYPRMLEGLSTTAAEFPFNSILLLFSVEANAAWQVARRLYQQVTGPMTRAANVVTNIIAGQQIGAGEYDAARSDTYAIVILGAVCMIPLSVIMIFTPELLVNIFTSDPDTIAIATYFTIVYGFCGLFEVMFRIFSGVLQAAGDTRKPFIAEIISIFLFMVGFSYIGSVYLEYGLITVYISIALYFATKSLLVAFWFFNSEWDIYAENLMKDRGSIVNGG